MKLVIVGTGSMGTVLYEYAREEGSFDTIYKIEPKDDVPWPSEKPDLLIDFSHPQAIHKIYDYCRSQGGEIPCILAATGYGPEEELVISLLEKICPLHRSTNYSRGMELMTKLCRQAAELSGNCCDIRVLEIHHTGKKDAPSGTAKTLCHALNISPDPKDGAVQSLRMGSVYGEHTVYLAMKDEVITLHHSALSRKIFAIGALEAGKKLMKR